MEFSGGRIIHNHILHIIATQKSLYEFIKTAFNTNLLYKLNWFIPRMSSIWSFIMGIPLGNKFSSKRMQDSSCLDFHQLHLFTNRYCGSEVWKWVYIFRATRGKFVHIQIPGSEAKLDTNTYELLKYWLRLITSINNFTISLLLPS